RTRIWSLCPRSYLEGSGLFFSPGFCTSLFWQAEYRLVAFKIRGKLGRSESRGLGVPARIFVTAHIVWIRRDGGGEHFQPLCGESGRRLWPGGHTRDPRRSRTGLRDLLSKVWRICFRRS